jgi:hypothetical protein
LYEEKERVLSVLFLEKGSELRRRLRKRLGNGTRRTRVLMLNSWFEKRAREENADILELAAIVYLLRK